MKRKIIQESMVELFQNTLVFSSDQLTNMFNCTYYCLRIHLKEIGYYTSFTHNAKYYTLANIPEFNSNGIWFYHDSNAGLIGFTKHKTATELLLHLINTSNYGISEEQLREIMKIRIYNQLNTLTKQSKIQRVRKEGKYYYYSNYAQQSMIEDLILPEIQSKSTKRQKDILSRPEKQSIGISISEDEHRRMQSHINSLERSCFKKQQKIRSHTFRIYDLKKSRDYWKQMAKNNKKEVKLLRDQIEEFKKNSSPAVR